MYILGLICSLCGLAGVIWVAVLAFQDGEPAWGIGSIICGIVAIVYAVKNMDRALIPLILMGVGIAGNAIVRIAAASGG